MSYYVRLILCAIFLGAIIFTFAVGIRWIVEHILSNFWSSILIILFTISSFAVSALGISIFIR